MEGLALLISEEAACFEIRLFDRTEPASITRVENAAKYVYGCLSTSRIPFERMVGFRANLAEIFTSIFSSLSSTTVCTNPQEREQEVKNGILSVDGHSQNGFSRWLTCDLQECSLF